MATYTPFEKSIEDLDELELKKLVEHSISEGWYIEYKSEIPRKSGTIDALKIARTVAAFANTNGGWFFLGVSSNDKNIATDISGIDLSDYDNICDQISRIIASNIQPTPRYHVKVVSLNTNKFVLIIKVDPGAIPPYITNQGIVYQRENNECNPIKDRYILEKMSEKTTDYYQSIESFCQMDYGETKGQSESNQSYLELYLFPLPFNEFYFKNFLSSDFFKTVAARFYTPINFTYSGIDRETILQLNLGFNSIYSSDNSIIIRPLSDKNFIYKTTTAELFINGGLKLLMPLNEFDINNVPSIYEESETIRFLRDRYIPPTDYDQQNRSTDFRNRYYSSQKPSTYFENHIKMVDGVELIYSLMIATSMYKAVLEDNDFKLTMRLGYRARITNTWRKFVFFDNSDYLEKIKLFNIPLAPKTEVEIPRFDRGNYYVTDLEQYSFLSIAENILHGIGLPDTASIKFSEIFADGLKRFSDR